MFSQLENNELLLYSAEQLLAVFIYKHIYILYIIYNQINITDKEIRK